MDHTIASADPFYASPFLRWVDVGVVDNDQAVAPSPPAHREVAKSGRTGNMNRR